MTWLGIKPVTFQLVARCLTQLQYRILPCHSSIIPSKHFSSGLEVYPLCQFVKSVELPRGLLVFYIYIYIYICPDETSLFSDTLPCSCKHSINHPHFYTSTNIHGPVTLINKYLYNVMVVFTEQFDTTESAWHLRLFLKCWISTALAQEDFIN
jgi:hypothetical protein